MKILGISLLVGLTESLVDGGFRMNVLLETISQLEDRGRELRLSEVCGGLDIFGRGDSEPPLDLSPNPTLFFRNRL